MNQESRCGNGSAKWETVTPEEAAREKIDELPRAVVCLVQERREINPSATGFAGGLT